MTSTRQAQTVQIEADAATLEGELVAPPEMAGLVVFAHGSGSSRRSPRNQFVAERIQAAGLGTLLFDLLTPEEARRDEADASLRFDIDLLATRLTGTLDWLEGRPELEQSAVGLFGASTGAAACLIAAAQRRDAVAAIVSRGGRPDLAGEAASRVGAPTLLIVGSRDPQVLEWNRETLGRLTATSHLEVVEGATHLFEEPGALERVADLAADWFRTHLLSVSQEAHHEERRSEAHEEEREARRRHRAQP